MNKIYLLLIILFYFLFRKNNTTTGNEYISPKMINTNLSDAALYFIRNILSVTYGKGELYMNESGTIYYWVFDDRSKRPLEFNKQAIIDMIPNAVVKIFK